LGRFAPYDDKEPFLLARLFPPKNRGGFVNAGAIKAASSPKQYANFRSIIPRSLSVSFEGQDLIPSESQESLVDLR
jgi:hypothetical protein